MNSIECVLNKRMIGLTVRSLFLRLFYYYQAVNNKLNIALHNQLLSLFLCKIFHLLVFHLTIYLVL